jgi:hypothetical protein
MMSATINRPSENVSILPDIVAELELGDIEQHIFASDFVESTDDTALEDQPEPFDGLGVDRSDDVLTFGVVNNAMWIFLV